MFGLGTQELLIILALVLVVFGAGKLPEVGKSLGGAINEFKRSVKTPVDDAVTAANAEPKDNNKEQGA
jgi:sec-independent protein translocase protein TatA